jgi:hypothetical protein
MLKKDYTQVISEFNNAGTSMRCAEVKRLLTRLGFEVKNGKRGGHKVFTHRHLSSFYSQSFNCDHGKNPEIKKPYINKIIKLLEQYKDDLVEYLEKKI